MSFQLGQLFNSYDEFMSALSVFQEASRHRFVKHYQKTVQWAAQNNVVPPPQQRLRYYRLKMNCSRKESKQTGDCGTWFRLAVTKDGENLEIVAIELKECGPPVDQTPPPIDNPSMSPMMQQQQQQPQQPPAPVYYDQQMYQPMEQYQAPPAQYDMATYQQPNQGDMQQGLPLPSFGHLGGFQQPPMVYGEGAPQQYADPMYQQQNYQQVDYAAQQMSAYPPQPLYPAPPAHHHDPNMQQGLPPVPMPGPAPTQNAQALQQTHPPPNQLQSPHMPPFPPSQQMYQPPPQEQPPPPQQQQYYTPMSEVMPPPPSTQHYQEMQPISQMVAPLPTDLSREQMAPQAPSPLRPSVVHQHPSAQPMSPYVEQAPGMLYTELGQPSQQMFSNHLQKALLDGVQHNDSKPMNLEKGAAHKPCQETSLSEAPGPIPLITTTNKTHSTNQLSPTQQHTQIINLKDLSASNAPHAASASAQGAATTLQALLGGPRRTSGSSVASQRSHNSDSDQSVEGDEKARGPVPDFHLGALFRSYKQAEQAVENYASPRGYKFRKIGSMLLKRIEGKEKLKEQFANANADPGIKYFALKFRCVRSRQLTMVSNYVKKKRDDDGQLIETPAVENANVNRVPVGSCNARITFQLNKRGTGLEVKQLDEVHDHPPDDEIRDRFAKGLTTRTRTKTRKQPQAIEPVKAEETTEEKTMDVKPPPSAMDDSFLNEHLLSDQPEVDLLSNIQSLTEEIDKLSETDGLPADLASLKHEDLGAIGVSTAYDQKVVPLQNGDAIIGRTVYDDKERGVAIVKAEGKLNDETLRRDALHRLNGHRETTEEQVVPKDHSKTPGGAVQTKVVDDSGKIVPEVFDDEKFEGGNDDNADSTRANCSSRAQSIQGDLSKESSPAVAASTEDDDRKTKRLFEREIKKLEINMCENVVTPNAVISLRKRSLKGGASPEHTSGVSTPAGGTVKKRIQEADLKKGEDDDSKLAEANNNINCGGTNTCSSSSTNNLVNNNNNNINSLDCETSKEADASAAKNRDASTGNLHSAMNNSTSSNGTNETSRRTSRMRTRGKRYRTTSNGSLLNDKSSEKQSRHSRGNGDAYEKSPDVRTTKRSRLDETVKSQHDLRACKVLVQMADLPKDFEVYWSKEDIAKQLQDADREECQDMLKSLGEIVQASEGETLSQHKACLTSILYHWRAGRPVTLSIPEAPSNAEFHQAPAASASASSPVPASSI